MGTPNLLDWIITTAVVASGMGAVVLSLLWRYLGDETVKKDARKSRPRKTTSLKLQPARKENP
jgi:hypothetical protein